MNKSLVFIRLFFTLFCILFVTTYIISLGSTGMNLTSLGLGIGVGLGFGLLWILTDIFLLQKCSLRTMNIAVIGLFVGYLMGEAILLVLSSALGPNAVQISDSTASLLKAALFLSTAYIGMALTARAAEEWQLSLPFIRFRSVNVKKKDTLIDWSILTDSRIIDIASSGLLDEQLLVPRFMLNELYVMLESTDEATRNKARRSLDVYKKLETIPTLGMRHTNIDFPDVKDSGSKLVQAAMQLDTNIITADVARLQQYTVEGIRIINIHMLSNVLKPMVTGEHINIKIQRYGKEPRQGVGYLDDGTMVVVNGGAEFLGDIIKAQVLSVKHTSSGRMIFCNAAEEDLLAENGTAIHSATADLMQTQKNYFAL